MMGDLLLDIGAVWLVILAACVWGLAWQAGRDATFMDRYFDLMDQELDREGK